MIYYLLDDYDDKDNNNDMRIRNIIIIIEKQRPGLVCSVHVCRRSSAPRSFKCNIKKLCSSEVQHSVSCAHARSLWKTTGERDRESEPAYDGVPPALIGIGHSRCTTRLISARFAEYFSTSIKYNINTSDGNGDKAYRTGSSKFKKILSDESLVVETYWNRSSSIVWYTIGHRVIEPPPPPHPTLPTEKHDDNKLRNPLVRVTLKKKKKNDL